MLKFAVIRTGGAAAIVLSVALLSGCGGEDGTASADSADTNTATTSTDDASATVATSTAETLSITGTPASTVKVGESFSFTPTTVGVATFSIQNKPAWANFDAGSGALSGTPAAAHVGTYSNIVISAANGAASAALSAFTITVVQVGASGGTATITWSPPTQNTDGSTVSNLAGYRIYYGASVTAMTNKINVTNPGVTAYTVADLGSGTHYFGLTAYTSDGKESSISEIGSKTVM